MKVNSLVLTVAVGLLAALPAHAWNGINNATYASRYRPVQPAASQAKSELQVAVMAKSTSQATATKPGKNPRKATNPHPWGPPQPYAFKSH
jgi:hypothetical protein